jgi:hypothetical protein
MYAPCRAGEISLRELDQIHSLAYSCVTLIRIGWQGIASPRPTYWLAREFLAHPELDLGKLGHAPVGGLVYRPEK